MAAPEHVASADGTRIAYRTWGNGDPILFVHGSATFGADWLLVLPVLRERFTIVSMDRRGRGASEDGPEYAMQREADDILAVLDATDARQLVGHSYGALCSILAAARTDRLRRFVIYEPPIAISEGSLPVIDQLVASGDHDTTLKTFLKFAGAPDEQLEAIRSSPAWPSLVTAIPTLPRELHAGAAWHHPRSSIDVPTLWLQGTETRSSAYLDNLEDVQGAFSILRRESIADQTHFAHVFAPEIFGSLIASFCADVDF